MLSWLALFSVPTKNLRIIACDVGQGDGILIIKGNFQMLIDGGPNNKVSSCLGKYIPFWDRQLEAVVLTHPDGDHSTGLVEVLKAYKVDNFITSEVDEDTQVYSALKNIAKANNIKTIFARAGNNFRVGEITFQVLSPTQEMFSPENFKSDKANDYSVVIKLTYNSFDAVFTGDIETEVSSMMANKYTFSDIEYLKVPHHGSKNGLSKQLLDEVQPELAVISAGRNNRFGHPNPEILKMLEGYKVLGTYKENDIIVESNGLNWWVVSQ